MTGWSWCCFPLPFLELSFPVSIPSWFSFVHSLPWCYDGKLLLHQIVRSEPKNPLHALLADYPLQDDPNRGYASWRLPFIIHANPERALDLWYRNPALILALDTGIWRGPEMPELLREALSGRDRDILATIRWPATDGLVHVLQRTACDVWNPGLLRKLRYLYESGGWRQRVLHHLPRVTGDAIHTLARAARRVSAMQVVEAGNSEICFTPVSNALRRLDALLPADKPWDYRHLDLDGLIAAAANLNLRRSLEVVFPPPPLPETETIRHIATAKGLLQEGKMQHNCAFSLTDVVKGGSYAVYQLLRPLCRTTVLIAKQPTYWCLAQLSGFNNCAVSREAVRDVLEWLKVAYPDIPAESLDIRSRDVPDWSEEEVVFS